MTERRKRRTQSAADVELAGSFPAVEPSPIAPKTRRKSSARQARLVAFPAFYNGMGIQSQTAATMSQPNFNQLQFPQSPVVYPPPQISNNSFIFTLLPGQREIPYSINIDKSHLGKAIFNVSGNVRTITFSINGTLFTQATPPIDITNLIVHGPNYLQFCTFGFTATSFVEIKLEDVQNPDVLVQKIINEFPAPPPINQDPYSTNICPISQTTIDKPGRGVNCTHSQCFDLKNFIVRAMEMNVWDCPVCGRPISFEELRYDRDYMKQNTFLLSDGDDQNSSLFSSLADPKFDPFDSGSLFADRDF